MVKFVIAGCGLAGMETALRLKKEVGEDADVTVVDKEQFFSHPDTLHEVFRKNPKELSVNRNFLLSDNEIEFVNEEINDVDVKKGKLKFKKGSQSFDYLCLALGTEPKKIKGKGYLTFDTLNDAEKVKKHITDKLASAPKLKDKEQEKALTIAVIGGGVKGTRLAAEINDFLDENCERHGVRRIDVKLILLEKKGTLMSGLPMKAGINAGNYLRRMGVDVRTNTEVVKATGSSFKTSDKSVDAGTVIWCGGSNPVKIFKGHDIHTDEEGKIILNKQMQSVTDAVIYGAGDAVTFRSAGYKGPRTSSSGNIVLHAKVASHNLASIVNGKEKKEYEYSKPALWIELGRKNTLLLWSSRVFSGWIVNALNSLRKKFFSRRFKL